jgi:hypothetical protein
MVQTVTSKLRGAGGRFLSKAVKAEIAEAAAEAARLLWILRVQDAAGRQAQFYVPNIGPVRQVGPTTFEVLLEDHGAESSFAVRLEEGAPPFHMPSNPNFPKVVAFRTAVSTSPKPAQGAQSIQQGFKQSLGSAAAEQFGQDLIKELRARPGIKKTNSKAQRGSQFGSAMGKESHAGPLYLGAKFGKAAAFHGGFVTFRTVDPDDMSKWNYPALPGLHIVDQIEKEVPDLVRRCAAIILGGEGV